MSNAYRKDKLYPWIMMIIFPYLLGLGRLQCEHRSLTQIVGKPKAMGIWYKWTSDERLISYHGLEDVIPDDVSDDNKHGDRFRFLRIGLFPFQMAKLHGNSQWWWS